MSRDSRLDRFGFLPRLDPAIAIMPARQVLLWPMLGEVPDDFVLYGGTALALRLGHRESVDFDFFSTEPFNPTELLEQLGSFGRATVNRSTANNLEFTAGEVNFSFFGGMRIQSVAEPSVVASNGLVVASLFDLAGAKAKAILDRSEWRDYVDIATLLEHGLELSEIVGYATTIFAPVFEFPASVFLRSLAYFEEGTARDVPDDMRREIEAAVVRMAWDQIPVVEPSSQTLLPS
jgi:hypothetical protein